MSYKLRVQSCGSKVAGPRFVRLASGWLASLLLAALLAGCAGGRDFAPANYDPPGPAQVQAPTVKDRYAGWAMVAYTERSYEEMLDDVQRMKAAGANVVWISHANPARPYKEEREIGLNPAVFDAFRDPAQISHRDAVEIVQAQKRLLKACQAAGLKAVLSVGYHTQMGLEWSRRHPQDLRRSANGRVWKASGDTDPYASVYSPAFRQDLKAYYDWIQFEFADPFYETVMMLNLADEPLGGDYSVWADREFERRTGYSFAGVGSDPQRQTELGRFQAGMVADYMKLAAGIWQTLRPDLPVTMSFDGGAMRDEHGLPNLEALFREAPPNFILTWDMYPRDRGTLHVPVGEQDVTRLIFLTRAIAGYSAMYGRKVWLWSAANSWGLGQNVNPNGTVADAQANLLYLALLINSSGGQLEGLAVWNYNVKTQGLYNYSWREVQQRASWNEDDMFERVSGLFGLARSIMAQPPGQPQLIFLRGPETQYRLIGSRRADYMAPLVDFARLDALARFGVATVETGRWPASLPANWSKTRLAVALNGPASLSEADMAGLRKWVGDGGQLVASLEVAAEVGQSSPSAWNSLPPKISYGRGTIYASRDAVESLFDSRRTEIMAPFWQEILGRGELPAGYVITAGSAYLHYYLGQGQAGVTSNLPEGWRGVPVYKYNADGSRQLLESGPVTLRRSEFIWAQK